LITISPLSQAADANWAVIVKAAAVNVAANNFIIISPI